MTLGFLVFSAVCLAIVAAHIALAVALWRQRKQAKASLAELDQLQVELRKLIASRRGHLWLVEPDDTPAAIEDKARESRRWWRKHF